MLIEEKEYKTVFISGMRKRNIKPITQGIVNENPISEFLFAFVSFEPFIYRSSPLTVL